MSREPARLNKSVSPGVDLATLLFVMAALILFFRLGGASAPVFGLLLFGAGTALFLRRRDASGRTELPKVSTQTSPAPELQAATSHRSAPTSPQATPPRAWDSVMPLYSLRTKFFSRTELAFYRALTRAVGTRYSVFAKVRLLDLCAITPTGDYTAMNKVSAKHVDFLLCEPSTFEPIAAIEVDGSSHQRPDRIERDEFVEDLFDQIGLPLIRVAAAYWFEPSDLARRIDAVVRTTRLEPARSGVGVAPN